MRYFIYEEANDIYETFLEVEKPQEAIEIGERTWSNLSKDDKKRCTEFSVCAIDDEYIEDGCISPNCPGWDVLKKFK